MPCAVYLSYAAETFGGNEPYALGLVAWPTSQTLAIASHRWQHDGPRTALQIGGLHKLATPGLGPLFFSSALLPGYRHQRLGAHGPGQRVRIREHAAGAGVEKFPRRGMGFEEETRQAVAG